LRPAALKLAKQEKGEKMPDDRDDAIAGLIEPDTAKR